MPAPTGPRVGGPSVVLSTGGALLLTTRLRDEVCTGQRIYKNKRGGEGFGHQEGGGKTKAILPVHLSKTQLRVEGDAGAKGDLSPKGAVSLQYTQGKKLAIFRGNEKSVKEIGYRSRSNTPLSRKTLWEGDVVLACSRPSQKKTIFT